MPQVNVAAQTFDQQTRTVAQESVQRSDEQKNEIHERKQLTIECARMIRRLEVNQNPVVQGVLLDGDGRAVAGWNGPANAQKMSASEKLESETGDVWRIIVRNVQNKIVRQVHEARLVTQPYDSREQKHVYEVTAEEFDGCRRQSRYTFKSAKKLM